MGFLSGISSFVKEHSEIIHGILDVAGFIPGVGAVADLANAGLYAAEGDYLNAALSFASAIPGIGDTVALAKKSVKAIKGGVKGLKKINALRKAKGMKAILAKMYGKAKTGALNLRKGTKNIDEVLDAVKNEIKEICTNGRCFTGDTLVYTSHGYKPIKEIQKGDEIYSRNEKTGEAGIKEVEEVFCTTAHTIYHVWVNGKEEFKTTAYHPIYVYNQGWVTAINLREGDAIETIDGFVHITKIEKTRHEEAVPVYNFHVKDWVSYFVGKIRSYVHNGNDIHTEKSISSFRDLMTPEEAARYEKYWKRNAPDFNTPGSKITHYKEHNNVIEESTVIYDYAGRQKWRIDYNNHGYSDHSIPHLHERDFSSGYDPIKGKETRYDIWR